MLSCLWEVVCLDYKIVGSNIRDARKKKGLTQKELGAAISRTESSVAKYEQGLVEIPDSVLSSIAQVLSVEPWKLRGYDGYIRVSMPEYPLSIPTKEQIDRMTKPEIEYYHLRLLADTDPDALRKQYTDNYDELNKLGQVEAVIRTKELTRLSEYTDHDNRAETAPESTPNSTEGKDTPAAQDAPEKPQEGE